MVDAKTHSSGRRRRSSLSPPSATARTATAAATSMVQPPVAGPGATGDEAYAMGKGAFDAYGHPVCTVNFPAFTTADIQGSAQYLVNGIRSMERRAGQPIAVIGISQGGLLPRFALTYWP